MMSSKSPCKEVGGAKNFMRQTTLNLASWSCPQAKHHYDGDPACSEESERTGLPSCLGVLTTSYIFLSSSSHCSWNATLVHII